MKLPPTYEPGQYESDIYALWEKSGAFQPGKAQGGEVFSMVAPPPNANANLHIGHALTAAVEDSIVRYQRLKGKSTLFVPGADHAGFETWVVYEKQLAAEGKSRFDFSREELYEQVWDFVELNKHKFESQTRALGVSCDWTRFTYTLDNKVVATAYQTFQKMWHDGLIYRGERIVNFCTFHGTAFADIEVEHQEEESSLWYIAYPLEDGSGEMVIATSRPETKMGQAALMVNPKDERYKELVGKTVLQPLVPDKPIKIIADEYVDIAFGTGVVTVTPGHDPNDFEVAQRHNLPIVELINTDGKMSRSVPEAFRGLTVMEAREAAVKALEQGNFIRKTEPYRHTVAKCYKCGTTIEPLLREQWFVKMQPLAKRAIEALQNQKIKFYPDGKRVQLITYLEGLRDWNISRQIAWGIPIPAFQNVEDPKDWIFDTRVKEATIVVDGKHYRRDSDVFDTWFSSGQWPYVTLNYPEGDDFKKFYPTSLMETGFDILYPWVARMIMLGLYVTGEIPFKDVYLHGLVTDEKGQKMSKSKGNVVNPMDIIGQYGSDALRMGLLTGQSAGNNQPFTHDKVVGARNFANKLWNITRFIEDKVGDKHTLRHKPEAKTIADHWILSRLSATSQDMDTAMGKYRLSEAYDLLYHFIWHDLADWYVEANKTDENLGVLAYVLDASLKLAHPFAPFVTETIWQTLAWEQGSLLINQRWPHAAEFDAGEALKFQQVTEVVTEARRISSVLGVSKPQLYYQDSELLTEQGELVARLAKLGSVNQGAASSRGGLKLTNTGLEAWLDIDAETAQNYLNKLQKQQTELNSAIAGLNARLNNPGYTEKAPDAMVAQTKQQLADTEKQLAALETELSSLKS